MQNTDKTLSDISGETEIRRMVDSFYEKIKVDEQLGPVFENLIKDWSRHMPTMYAFWGSILLGREDYRGNPMAKHLDLPVDSEHFARWIELFVETIDQLFAGPKSEQAKAAAKSIAHTFQIRMGIDPFQDSGKLI